MVGLKLSIEEKLREFLKEDIGFGDITSEALIGDDQMADARIFYRENGIAAGLEEVAALFQILGCNVKTLVEDGDEVNAGEILIEIKGPAKSLLAGERTSLNILGRMAGIATAVAEMVAVVAEVSPNTRVASMRKTIPGLREFDKKAVVLGGGDTHRFRLDDCVLIKDNHMTLMPSVSEAVKRARNSVSFTKLIEVEVETLEAAMEAAEAGADIIMFDNMSPAEIRSSLSNLAERGLKDGRLYEASGGINPKNIAEYAASGVDVISMGYFTHSVRSLDVKLKIEMIQKGRA
jgi:nicotinate-nucleotide pyrophosphorylase (carboxylating)